MDNSTTESESDDSSSLESKQVQNGEDLERELRELFEYLDADRDSVLDKDEFERAFFELEIFLETSELDRLFKKYSSTVYPDGEVGVNYHHFRAVLRELTKRRETKKRSFLSARKLVRVLSRIGHMKNSLRDTIRTSIVKVMSPKRSSAKSKIKSKKSIFRINSWSGYQWLEQFSVEVASVMSQSTRGMDATCNEFSVQILLCEGSDLW